MPTDEIAEQLYSVNESDRNGEPANVVDAIFAVARSLDRLGNADAGTAMGGLEALGAAVSKASENISGAIEHLADTIEQMDLDEQFKQEHNDDRSKKA